MKILIAIDSFKGCFTSAEVGTMVKEVIENKCPTYNVEVFPIADGGEGTLPIMSNVFGAENCHCAAHDPLMRPIDGTYSIIPSTKTALIEMADVNGLPLLKDEERNPMLTTTYGTDELIKDALNKGCTEFIVGLGGSATNDAGVGMLQALGYHFYDQDNKEVGLGGKYLSDIVSFSTEEVHPHLKEAHFSIACDVSNPLYGKEGAAYVFAKQKGADSIMIENLDKGLRSFSTLIENCTHRNIAYLPGSGAAGGLGGGMVAFLNAELKSGAELIMEMCQLQQKIHEADMLITGEGKMDAQTLMGKIPGKILQIGKANAVKVIGIAGSIEDEKCLKKAGYHQLYAITPKHMSLQEAMTKSIATENLRNTVCKLLNEI